MPIRQPGPRSPPLQSMDRWPLTLVVFVSSACVMILELVAGRIVAPYIGVSIFAWTSVIGVVLAGVSLGNSLGGRLADRGASPRLLGILLALSGLASLSVLAVDMLVLDAGGEVVSNASFDIAPILCFRPNEYYRTLAEAGQSEIFVQRYADEQIPGSWVDLNHVMGWEGDQVCAGLDHLSLFALAYKPSDASRLPFGGDDPPPETEPGVERLYSPAGMP